MTEKKRGFKKKQPGEEADPNIWRGGRAYYKTVKPDDSTLTYKDLGRLELLRLFRKVKPHTKDAIEVMRTLMMKESAEDNTRLKAALSFMAEYRNLAKEIYDSDELVNPEDERANNKPAAVLHLQVVKTMDKLEQQLEKSAGADNGEE